MFDMRLKVFTLLETNRDSGLGNQHLGAFAVSFRVQGMHFSVGSIYIVPSLLTAGHDII